MQLSEQTTVDLNAVLEILDQRFYEAEQNLYNGAHMSADETEVLSSIKRRVSSLLRLRSRSA